MASSRPNAPPSKRLRARKACVPCRRRKRKCDGGVPCGMCCSYGYECKYSDEIRPLAALSNRQVYPKQGTFEAIGPVYDSQSPVKSRSHSTDISNPSTSTQRVNTHRGIFDQSKSRYMSLHSAVAFPRSLGLELQSESPPRLHSFAWNCGIRHEELPNPHCILLHLVTEEEYHRFAATYFSVVHPLFDIIDYERFKQSAESYWEGSCRASAFGAVLGGVIALGSLFSGNDGHPRELDIVQYSKGILEDPTFSRLPSVEQVSAWVLRTIYLRATTRPHVAWLASCTTMHLAEATALHHEVDKVELETIEKPQPIQRAKDACERARRLFWCAWSINSILSYDYGRSSVTLNRISCKPVTKTDNNYTAQLVELAMIIPQGSAQLSSERQINELLEALARIHALPDVHSFLSLTKADLCHSFYRRLRQLNHALDKSVVFQIISIGNTALSAGYDLIRKNQAWWNVLSTVFQYFCVLLAIDTPESLLNVAAAKSTLDNIVQILDTDIAIEAQSTAKLLLRDSMKKKKLEVAQLEIADQEGPSAEVNNPGEIDWDAFFDPSYTSRLIQQDFATF